MASPSNNPEDTSDPASVRGRSDPLEAGKITEAAKEAVQNTAPTFPDTSSATDFADGNSEAITQNTPSTEQDVTFKHDTSATAKKQGSGAFWVGSHTPISVMTPEEREAYRLRVNARRASRTSSIVQGPQRTMEEKHAEFFKKYRFPKILEDRYRERFAKNDAERRRLAQAKEGQSMVSMPDLQNSGADSGTNEEVTKD